jgi:DNA-binding NtrC family response regulator
VNRRPYNAQQPLVGERILIVDDEILIGLNLEDIFAGAGADVVGPCTTLREAMEAAADENLSAAVLDIRLGQQTTENVAQLLEDRHIPYVFYTGQPAAAGSVVCGTVTTIIKPARARQLIEAVIHLLAG